MKVKNPTQKDIRVVSMRGHSCLVKAGEERDLPDSLFKEVNECAGLDIVSKGDKAPKNDDKKDAKKEDKK